MKIVNRSKAAQTVNGITIRPGETFDSGDGVEKTHVPDDAELQKLRADYQEIVGKRAYHGWDAAELQKRIDAALAA